MFKTAYAHVEKSLSLLTVLAMIISLFGFAAPQIASAEGAPALTNVDAYYAAGTGYTGIGIDFSTEFVKTATDIELIVHGGPAGYSIHATPDLIAGLNALADDGYTRSGTVLITGARSSGSWTPQVGTWVGSERPTSVEVIITLEDGTELSMTDNTIVDNGGNTEETVFADVPATASEPALINVDAYYAAGTGYTGIGVDFKMEFVKTATDVELILHGGPAGYSIHGTQVLFDAINESTSDTYTTSGTVVITGSRTSSSGSWETMNGTWVGAERPTSVEVIVTLEDGTELKMTDNTIVENGGNTEETVFADVPVTPVCTYDFDNEKMWEVTWGYGFDDRNGGAPVFNTKSHGGLTSLNGGVVPAYITNYDAANPSKSWHWLYVTDNGNYDPRHIDYGFADGTVWTVDYTWVETNGCHTPVIVWNEIPPDTEKPTGIITYDGGTVIDSVRHFSSINDFSFEGEFSDNKALARATYVVFKVDENFKNRQVFCGNWNANANTSKNLTGTNDTLSENVANCSSAEWLDGYYEIAHRVYDAAGNFAGLNTPTEKFVIALDNTAPSTPMITQPTARQWFNGKSTVNSWSASTDASGIEGYEVKYEFVGRATVTRFETGLSRTQSFTGSYQGPITISVRAKDNAGNWSPFSPAVTYNYDSIAPVTDIAAPTSTVGSTFTISGDASDNLGLNRVYVQLVNRSNSQRYGGTTINLIPEGTDAHWSHTYDFEALGYPEGDYAAHVAVVDRAGNSSTAGWTTNFTVDFDNDTVVIPPTPPLPIATSTETETENNSASSRSGGTKVGSRTGAGAPTGQVAGISTSTLTEEQLALLLKQLLDTLSSLSVTYAAASDEDKQQNEALFKQTIDSISAIIGSLVSQMNA